MYVSVNIPGPFQVVNAFDSLKIHADPLDTVREFLRTLASDPIHRPVESK